MNSFIMAEWLTSFYLHIGPTRRVLLTMDNFPAHIAAVESTPPPPNIRITWLPPNATSRFQALDQGIIAAMKAYYRRQWLQFMLECFENDCDPFKSMNIHLALRWLIRSWNQDVTNTTIFNCFRKSSILLRPQQLPTHPIPVVTDLYNRVQQAGQIHDAMDISNFLNPAEESIQDIDERLDEDETLQEVMAQYLQTPEAQDDDSSDELPVPTTQAALKAIQVLIEYSESINSSSEAATTEFLRSLERKQRQLEAKQANDAIQSTLDIWIT
jgi:hypothetical protein